MGLSRMTDAEEYNDGIVLVLSEMALQNYTTQQITDMMEPMGFGEDELIEALQRMAGKDTEPEEWPSFCKKVFDAWKQTEEGKEAA